MSRNGKVILAMSGGVDSSVAAALLKEQGYDVVGVFLRVGSHAAAEPSLACAVENSAPATPPQSPRRLRHGCCSSTDAADARAVAGRLGLPFYALNFEQDFDRIIDYFVDEYARGRTPNPCVQCNIRVKFGRLLRYADAMDAAFVATGHYARRLVEGPSAALARARNLAKDQSYVLFGIGRSDLPRCLFPLGDFTDKHEVRRLASKLALRVHDKPDSQEICFVPNNDYRGLLRSRRPDALREGELRDGSGRVLTTHRGVATFTIGQRRGLGLATGEPLYVTRLDVLNNAVTVGPRSELLSRELFADGMNWLCDPPREPTRIRAKIRHTHEPAAATLCVSPDGAVSARFDEPQLAITPGQAAVFYDDADRVLGGGWIRDRDAHHHPS